MSDILERRIADLIEPAIEDEGLELVRVRISGQPKTLQIMVEKPDYAHTDVDDCARASRAVSVLLDVDDPITDNYQLEVSTPGIDRPLTREKDYAQFAGHLAKLETKELIEGRRRFKGTLMGVEDGAVTIDCEEFEAVIAFENIARGKLLLTDALIEASRPDKIKN